MKFEAREVIFLDASMNEAVFGRKVACSVAQGFSPSFVRLDNEKKFAWEDKFPLPRCGKGGTLSLRFDVNHPSALLGL